MHHLYRGGILWAILKFIIIITIGIIIGYVHYNNITLEGKSSKQKVSASVPMRRDKKIHLITQLYLDDNPFRRAEIMESLCNNILNRYIFRIHLLQSVSIPNVYNHFKHHCNVSLDQFSEKLRFYSSRTTKDVEMEDEFRDRLSAGAALTFASRYLSGTTTILSNSDIYFDRSLKFLEGDRWLSLTNTYFLSRYEADEAISIGTQCGPKYIGSHDSIIFVPPLPRALIKNAMGLPLGVPGIENRLLYEFRKYGATVMNPCKTIRSWHLHSSGKRKDGLPQLNSRKSAVAFPSMINNNPTLDDLNL